MSPPITIIHPCYKILTPIEEIKSFPKRIEMSGRTAYQSHDRITEGSAEKFCKMLIRRGHTSVLEHCVISVKIICDRATSHQFVRHRVGIAFTQESQRYVRYDESLKVIMPNVDDTEKIKMWYSSVCESFGAYRSLIKAGTSPEEARSVLPNCTATEIDTTANIAEWRHIFKMRCDPHAQTQIREIMIGLRDELAQIVPCLFG